MMNAIFLLGRNAFPQIYSPQQVEEIGQRVRLVLPPQFPDAIDWENPELREVEAIFGGWGTPKLEEQALERLPALKVVFYGAGSIRVVVSEAFWERGARITSAAVANAIPVAEFSVAQIILALKNVFPTARALRSRGSWMRTPETMRGAFHSTVGLLSLGLIGRLVAERLQRYDVNVIAYDPHADPAVAANLGVALRSLDEVFATADVVSCHTPLLPETTGMLGKAHFSAMKENAAFINTARGAVVNEPELIEVLARRPDLHAILDVTHPEPPEEDSSLYTLPNVFLTPHVAGSIGPECHRMAQVMIEELDRYLSGKRMKYEVTREESALRA